MPPLDPDQAGIDQLLHMVGEQRLPDVEQREQLALTDVLLTAAQGVKDLYAQRLGERLGRRRDSLGVKRGAKTGGRSTALPSGGTCGKNRKRKRQSKPLL